MENRALGKGLSALIPEKVDLTNAESLTKIKTSNVKVNSNQPRKHYDDERLSELIASVKEKGVLQPILVREKDGGYEVIAGERRLRAARALNMEEVPVVIKEVSDQEALVLALIENIQREELNPIEEADAYKRLLEDYSFTQEDVARSVGKDRSTISNILRLLKLPEEIQRSIAKGAISEGHARALLSVENKRELKQLFEYSIKKGLSVRELEQLVKTGLGLKYRREKSKLTKKDYNVVALEERLQQILGTKVSIMAQKKRGKVVIEYYSNEDLDRIINIIKK